MKVLLLSFFSLLFVVFGVNGQTDLSVERFTLLPNDMEARSLSPIRDANGDLTALIKVVTNEQGFDFDGGSLGIVKVMPQPGEIWVYVPDRARSITIRHGKFGVLRNYAYPVPVKSGNVYEMKLSHGTVEVVVKPREIVTEWFVVASTPAGADVYLDDQAVGKTPFSAELPEGRYTWRIERNLYQTEAGVAELSAGQRVALDIDLKPNFGRVELTSVPDDGAQVLLNGIDVGKQTPCVLDELPVGNYTLTLSHQWFETTTQMVEVAAGDVNNVEVAMQPIFGELVLTPASGVRYFVNDKEEASELIRLAPGVYTVEARKPSHAKARVQVVIERGKRQTPELVPQPLYGKLRVQSQPFGARIEVDGVEVGDSPFTLRELLVGEHNVTVTMEGYLEHAESVQVSESVTTDLSITLEPIDGSNSAKIAEEATATATPNTQTKVANSEGSSTGAESDLQRILSNYFEAIGGLEKLRSIRSYTEEAHLDMESMGMKMTYTRQLKLPDKIRITTDFSQTKMTQVVNGSRGIMVMDGNTTTLEQAVIDNLKQQMRFDGLADLIEQPDRVLFVGEREFEGVKYHSIETIEANGTRIVYHFNRSTHLMDVMETAADAGGETSRFISRIEDYKEVDGLLFPSRFSMDSATGLMVYTFSRIEVNPPLSDTLFELR